MSVDGQPNDAMGQHLLAIRQTHANIAMHSLVGGRLAV